MNIRHGHWNAARIPRTLSHHTDDGLEVVYVRNGKIYWEFEGKPTLVRAGELSFTWPWQTHAALGESLPPVDIYWVLLPLSTEVSAKGEVPSNMKFQIDVPSSEGKSLLTQLGELPHQVLKPKASFRQKFISLVDGLSQNEGKLDLATSGWLYLTLGEIEDAINLAHESEASEDSKRLQVEQFLDDVLAGSLQEDWSLDRMANACALGRTAFADCVKKIKGDSPVRVLARMRVERAKQFLRQTEMPITRIASQCGFSSSQRFATVFKEYAGGSPSSYKSRGLGL